MLWVIWMALCILSVASFAIAVLLCCELWSASISRLFNLGRAQFLLASQTSSKPAEVADNSLAVLIPAHDEGKGIATTLKNVLNQLAATDRILVVADNCSDDTADIARSFGVSVVVREDFFRKGKGYALECGVEALRQSPPANLLILDADCLMAEGCVAHLRQAVAQFRRPIQALYLMENQDGRATSVSSKLRQFAWIIRNHARPLGADYCGIPCQLMGSGMLIPWDQISKVSLGSSNLAEDMLLGSQLATFGFYPKFYAAAKVSSFFPSEGAAEAQQTKRWIHGHLRNLFGLVPELLWTSLKRRELQLAGFALEMAIPPLAGFLVASLLLAVGGAVIGAWTNYLPTFLASSALVMILSGLAAVWYSFGRQLIRLRDFISFPGFLFRRFAISARFLTRPEKEWIRTKRDP